MRKIIIFSLTFGLCSITSQAAEVYHDPVDGKDYVADKWVKYTPDDSSQSPEIDSAKVDYEIRLLSAQSDFEEINAPTLSNYIRSIERILNKQVDKYGGNGQIITQIELNSIDNPKFSISRQGNISEKLLQNYYDEIKKLPPLKSKTKKLTFQITFNIKN